MKPTPHLKITATFLRESSVAYLWAEPAETQRDTLVLEMNRPLDGVIKASDAPLRKALELIDK
jgi:hypothetical protein